MNVSVRVYRWLLRAYPAQFRHDYQDDMLQLFRDCCRDADRQGRGALVALWGRTLYDLGMTITHEWINHTLERHTPMTNTFDRQLGNSIFSMTTLLRSGYSVMQALQMIAEKSPEPIASAFQKVVTDVKNGVNFDDAFDQLQHSTQSDNLTKMIATMREQRQRGSNLAVDLEPLAEAIRQSVGDDPATKTVLDDFRQMTQAE